MRPGAQGPAVHCVWGVVNLSVSDYDSIVQVFAHLRIVAGVVVHVVKCFWVT